MSRSPTIFPSILHFSKVSIRKKSTGTGTVPAGLLRQPQIIAGTGGSGACTFLPAMQDGPCMRTPGLFPYRIRCCCSKTVGFDFWEYTVLEKSFDSNYNAPRGSAPAAMASPGCDLTVLPVRNRGEISRLGNNETSQCAPAPNEGRVGARGMTIAQKEIFSKAKYSTKSSTGYNNPAAPGGESITVRLCVLVPNPVIIPLCPVRGPDAGSSRNFNS